MSAPRYVRTAEQRMFVASRPENPTDLPCPKCGQRMIHGLLFVNERQEHMNTWYICAFWASGKPLGTGRCGWTGFFVPGWDEVDRDDQVDRRRRSALRR